MCGTTLKAVRTPASVLILNWYLAGTGTKRSAVWWSTRYYCIAKCPIRRTSYLVPSHGGTYQPINKNFKRETLSGEWQFHMANCDDWNGYHSVPTQRQWPSPDDFHHPTRGVETHRGTPNVVLAGDGYNCRFDATLTAFEYKERCVDHTPLWYWPGCTLVAHNWFPDMGGLLLNCFALLTELWTLLAFTHLTKSLSLRVNISMLSGISLLQPLPQLQLVQPREPSC